LTISQFNYTNIAKGVADTTATDRPGLASLQNWIFYTWYKKKMSPVRYTKGWLLEVRFGNPVTQVDVNLEKYCRWWGFIDSKSKQFAKLISTTPPLSPILLSDEGGRL